MQGRCSVQVKPEDGQLLNKQQAAKAEDQDLLRYFVTPPHHPGSEAGGLGLVFMQEKQRLRWGHGAFAFLDGRNGFITSSRRILQKGEETATGPPQKPQCPQSREVLERDRGRALS